METIFAINIADLRQLEYKSLAKQITKNYVKNYGPHCTSHDLQSD